MPGWSQNPFWADEAEADSDVETVPLTQPAPPPSEKKKKEGATDPSKKRGGSNASASKKKKTSENDSEDLSLGRNLFAEEPDEISKQLKPVRAASLQSFLSQRGTSGYTTQRDLVRAGEYYIELRVYNSQEVENEPNDERWKRALITLKLCANTDTAVWRAVSSLVQAGKREFKSIQPIMYPKPR